MYLLEHLTKVGAVVTVTDTNKESLAIASQRFGATVVDLDAIYDVPCDIFAPCAIGQTVNAMTLKRLSCRIIAGAANNQLPDRSVYAMLSSKGILYCPDFVINSGGVICVSAELSSEGPKTSWVQQKVEAIYDTTARVLNESEARGRFAEEVAVELAKEVVAEAKRRTSR
jgi:leucine dehydrogenase